MVVRERFKCELASGLHARPASVLAAVFAASEVRATISRESGGLPADARSVLSIVALEIEYGEEFMIEIEAEDAEATSAVQAVREVVHRQWPMVEVTGRDRTMSGGGGRNAIGAFDAKATRSGASTSDGAISRTATSTTATSVPTSTIGRLPAPLVTAENKFIAGIGIGDGVGDGIAVVSAGSPLIRIALSLRDAGKPGDVASAIGAMNSVQEDLRRRAEAERGEVQADVLRAHAAIAGDPALREAIVRECENGVGGAAGAIARACEHHAGLLLAAKSELVRQRAADIRDVCSQALTRLDVPALKAAASATAVLSGPSIIVASGMTPGELLALDHSLLHGLVLADVGATSHVVIVARSLGVPTLLVSEGARRTINSGEQMIVDATSGVAMMSPDVLVENYYALDRLARQKRARGHARFAHAPGVTGDGRVMHVGVNASDARDVIRGVASGADGVGLLRTELLFTGRATPPSEDEQADMYADVLTAAAGRPAIIRVLDIGGDKPLDYLDMPREENPFLGIRGVRLLMRRPELLMTQLRAIARAGEATDAQSWIMAPMIAIVSEVKWFRERVMEAFAASRARPPRVGVMIETPSAAMSIDLLAPHVEFFSIGTNDLQQYLFAADRGNAALAGEFGCREPVFIRTLDRIVRDAKAAGRWVGVCGDMASDPANLALFAGLGVDEVSVAGIEPSAMKARLSNLDSVRCRALVDAAMALSSATAVDELLAASAVSGAGASSVCDVDLVEIEPDVEGTEKWQAIKIATDVLWAVGRANDRRELERAVWAREATYATDVFGHGFAIPHCQSDSVAQASVAVVRLKRPIRWSTAESDPVDMVLLLAMPKAAAGANAHLKLLATLARKLMHEEFRDSLRGAATPEAMVAVLEGAISPR